jgi:hypothetical protein
MKPRMLGVLLYLASGSAAYALPPPVEIAFAAGHVTVSAADAPVADVLAAWGLAGHADLVGAAYLGTRRISIRLMNAPEADALRAIVGSPAWYTTVARETPGGAESAFQRIVILPAAQTARAGDDASMPERRFTYYDDSDAAAGLAALMSLPSERQPDEPRPQGDPESIYQYAPATTSIPDDPRMVPPPASENRQPLFPTSGADPETIYEYSPTPEPLEPVPSSTVIPAPVADPEVRFQHLYAPAALENAPDLQVIAGGIPGLPVFTGFDGLLRLPGRVVRYVIDR